MRFIKLNNLEKNEIIDYLENKKLPERLVSRIDKNTFIQSTKKFAIIDKDKFMCVKSPDNFIEFYTIEEERFLIDKIK